MNMDLSGKWQAKVGQDVYDSFFVPGTLDTNMIGNDDKEKLSNRLTRVCTYEGSAVFSRKVFLDEIEKGKRLFLEVERARCLKLYVNGEEAHRFKEGTLSTPYIFEITDLAKQENMLEIVSDNSYPGLPHDDIVYSSAATDETQTNWNGLLGYVRICTEEAVFISDIRIYPHGGYADVQLDICAGIDYDGEISIQSPAFESNVTFNVSMKHGTTQTIAKQEILLKKTVKRWDEYEGNLYSVIAVLSGGETKQATFGVRDFTVNDQARLALNGRTIFIRSEANCCVFPETGHMPMTEKEWDAVLSVYAAYGVNCMRFHSHCPPDAAFRSADKLGMLMQPELSHWNPRTAFENDESYQYYLKELKQIILTYANHPSFVMLTLGNELHAGELGHARMDEILRTAHELDTTRLYSNGSNTHYGEKGPDSMSDFYTAQRWLEDAPLRGTFGGQKGQKMSGYINRQYPSTTTNYDKSIEKVHEKFHQPVFGFEVGQFEVLPDFDEIKDFNGVTRPVNFEIIKNNVEAQDLLPYWKEYVNATGELSRIGYREEIEAVLRTEGMSGISLLGLQDFPGQGTALVGMLNSHLQSKPYPFADPAKFRKFFASVVPLLLMPKYTYENNEMFRATIKLANYGKNAVQGKAGWKITGNYNADGTFDENEYRNGKLSLVGEIAVDLSFVKTPARLDIEIYVGEYSNTYPIWVYPCENTVCPESIRMAESLDQETEKFLTEGGCVLLNPNPTKENLPDSIAGQFTTDFWSVGTFSAQDGGMGFLIDTVHPALSGFPTESYSNWQWWAMSNGRPVIIPKSIQPIVTVMDSYSRLKHMAALFECKVGKGKLVFCSMGLMQNKEYPEVRALLRSILSYMNSGKFNPKSEVTAHFLHKLVKS